MIMKLFNTLSQQLEIFKPENQNKVKIYVCGPTVYDRPHLGNVRSVVVYDILYRTLIAKYGSSNVLYVRNITDVDDKINNAAKERNITINSLTKEITEYFHEDVKALNCLSPNIEPKATDHINEMIDMIKILIKNGNAYISNNHVYFNVKTYSKYGELSSQNIEKLSAGIRIDISANKQNLEDFVLWKPEDTEDDQSSIFDSPWGKGRPGWHIECSAMSIKYLGQNFDIHGGGADLIFPHHTNEIAQSCACFPGSCYAKFWVHNGFLTVNGEKMSKSLGNFFSVREILNKGIQGEVIRYLYLSTHYKKPLNWTEKGLIDAKKSMDSFYRILEEQNLSSLLDSTDDKILNVLYDDLNTPQALSILHETAKTYNKTVDEETKRLAANQLYMYGKTLGLFNKEPIKWFKSNQNFDLIEQMVLARAKEKSAQNWKNADLIRQKLLDIGVILEDLKDGTTKWRKS